MSDTLLVNNIDVEIADHHDAATCADRLLAAAELAGLHIPLHDVDAVLLIEVDATDFVKANDVILRDKTALTRRVVYKHPRDRRLAARHQVRIRRDLLVEMRLTR